MKKLQNIISFTLTIILILIILIPSILFSSKDPFSSILLVPGTNNVYDNSTVESILEAGEYYEQNYDQQFNYLVPNTFDKTSYQEIYNISLKNGTQTLVTIANKNQELALKEVMQKYPNKQAIFLDDTSWTFNDTYSNVKNIRFQSQEVAFIEGILSSIYLVSKYPHNDKEWKIGIWGGMQQAPVVQWMSGFEQGINWFNYYFLGTDINNHQIVEKNSISLKMEPGKKVKLINFSGEEIDYQKNAISSSDTFFSNSYNIGEGQQFAFKLINQGANVLFPIAGGQTVDALMMAEKYSTKDEKIYVIGVDTDAKQMYPQYQDNILSSAIKNFNLASYYSIWFSQKQYQNDQFDYFSSLPYKNPYYFITGVDNGGWNYSQPSLDIINEQNQLSWLDENDNCFLATIENKGISVTDLDKESLLQKSWEILFDIYPLLINLYSPSNASLLAFIDFSYQYQNQQEITIGKGIGGIESFSSSFLLNGKDENKLNLSPYTNPNGNLPWIPNWQIYK